MTRVENRLTGPDLSGAQVFEKIGGRYRTRTYDPLIKSLRTSQIIQAAEVENFTDSHHYTSMTYAGFGKLFTDAMSPSQGYSPTSSAARERLGSHMHCTGIPRSVS